MTAHTHYLWFSTKRAQEIIDITDDVAEQVRVSGVREGFVLVSAMHISASVFVNDHESGLWHDILHWLEHTIAPWDPARYQHNETGEDNAAAHLRSLTMGHEVIVPVTAGRPGIGMFFFPVPFARKRATSAFRVTSRLKLVTFASAVAPLPSAVLVGWV